MIFTVGGTKGGTGKSTMATHLAIWLSRQGFDVLLVDADEQETATKFSKWREQSTNGNSGYTATVLTDDSVRQQVVKFKKKYDHIVIDAGGRDTTSLRAALVSSDALLIPFPPRSYDVWTLPDVEKLVQEARSLKEDTLHAFSFLNKADVQGNDNRDSAEYLASSEIIEYIDSPIIARKAYANTASAGLSVFEGKPIDEKAFQEINLLFNKILSKLDVYLDVENDVKINAK